MRIYSPPRSSDAPALEPYWDFHRERVRAHDKHDPKFVAGEGRVSSERREWDDLQWLAVLVEEVGEVAMEFNEPRDHETVKRLRAELVQVGAMAAAWVDAIDARNTSEEFGAPPARMEPHWEWDTEEQDYIHKETGLRWRKMGRKFEMEGRQ